MKTAMQELIEWYYKEHFVKTTFHIQLLNKFEKLLEKEKEQIRKAYLLGHYDSSLDIYNPSECYNEIQKQN
jgi:hypothetical protein